MALAACLAGVPAGAQLRPVPRPEMLVVERPVPRPDTGGKAADVEGEAPPESAAGGEAGSGDGVEEPADGAEAAEETAEGTRAEEPAEEAEASEGGGEQAAPRGGTWLEREGPLCGLPSVRGERLEMVEDAGACGIVWPVRVEAVAGVALEPPPALSCPAVEALEKWLTESAKSAFEAQGAPLVGLGVAAGYVCRNVNYAADGNISEHAVGLALDVSRFEREGGEAVTVLEGWESETHGALLRDVFEGACGIFGTALGPDSDAYHQDHFHLGAADRRRAYCPDGYEPEEAGEEAEADGTEEAEGEG